MFFVYIFIPDPANKSTQNNPISVRIRIFNIRACIQSFLQEKSIPDYFIFLLIMKEFFWEKKWKKTSIKFVQKSIKYSRISICGQFLGCWIPIQESQYYMDPTGSGSISATLNWYIDLQHGVSICRFKLWLATSSIKIIDWNLNKPGTCLSDSVAIL